MKSKIVRAGLALFVSVTTVALVGTAAGAAGRYKKDGTKCVWDAKDSGPNQCQPVTAGHFKKSGDACTWVANEGGADDCQPSKGRFKKNGSACEWNATDSGPNQCDPRQVK